MPSITSRPFERSLLPDLLSITQANANARWPGVTYLLNSDIAWRLPGSSPEENIRLWFDNLGIAGYAWFQLNDVCTFDLREDITWDSEIPLQMIRWLEKRRTLFGPLNPWSVTLNSMQEWETALSNNLHLQAGDQSLLHLGAFDLDAERIQFLADQGYESTRQFHYYMTRDLDIPIPEPEMPDNMILKHVSETEFDERVETHRDAWFKSTYSMDTYLELRAIDMYDPELDIVVATGTGEFASYCIGWVDKTVGVGSFEPVGTRPAYRRLGLGRLVNYEGLRRMKAKGMHSAKIGTAGFNDPAFGLYSSCGFKLIDKERTYLKSLGLH
ncbi:MAG: GNAT family N-acetyltransferase [bacterium]|nr:GNAT family N-acetyltransferase [Gammaproteobacteria bacterium]